MSIYITPGYLTSREANLLNNLIHKVSAINATMPRLDITGGYFISESVSEAVHQTAFWAELTDYDDTSGYYAWHEVVTQGGDGALGGRVSGVLPPSGRWEEKEGARAGDLTVHPAFEANGVRVPVGTVVSMRLSDKVTEDTDWMYVFDHWSALDVEEDGSGNLTYTFPTGDTSTTIILPADVIIDSPTDGLPVWNDPTEIDIVTEVCPRQIMETAAMSTSSVNISSATPADITGCSIDIEIPSTASGSLKVVVHGDFDWSGGSGSDVYHGILDVDGSDETRVSVFRPSGSNGGTHSITWRLSLATGSYTLKLQAARSSGTGNADVNDTGTGITIISEPYVQIEKRQFNLPNGTTYEDTVCVINPTSCCPAEIHVTEDVVVIEDDVTLTLDFGLGISENLIISDAGGFSRVADANRVYEESLVITENFSRIADALRAIQDALEIQDTVEVVSDSFTPGTTCAGAAAVTAGVTYGPFNMTAPESHWFSLTHGGGDVRITLVQHSGSPDPADDFSIWSDCSTIIDQTAVSGGGCLDSNESAGTTFFNVSANVGDFSYSVTIETAACP